MELDVQRAVNSLRQANKRATAVAAAAAISVALTASAAQGAGAASLAASTSVPIVALSGYQVSLFAKGTTAYFNPDAIIQAGQHAFIDYQNKTAKDGTDNNSSTIVEYNLDGSVVKTFSVGGHSDGMRLDPNGHTLWATSNEDGNAVLHSVDVNTGAVTAYSFSSAPHGGGYDDLLYLGGQWYVVASNPTANSAGVNVFPALDRMIIQGSTAQLTPVLMGNATATDTTTNATVTLNAIDPDSLSVDAQGNLVLIDQAGDELITLHGVCTAQQTVTRIPTGTQLDDTVWATSAQGQLYVVDAKANATYIMRSTFTPGTIYTELPSDSGVASAVGTLDPTTGFITPIAIGFGSPTGMIFVPDNPTPASTATSNCTSGPSSNSSSTTSTPTSAASELAASQSGTLAGAGGGSFADYQISSPTTTPFTLTLNDGAFDSVQAHRFGFNVYQKGALIGSSTAKGKGAGDGVDTSSAVATITANASDGPVLIQIFNYSTTAVPYTLTRS